MQKFTDRADVERTMQAFMLNSPVRKTPFLFEIRVAAGAYWNGNKIGRGGLIIEGARPIGAITECDTCEKTYSLSNSDSNYTRTIGQVRLQDISSLTTLD